MERMVRVELTTSGHTARAQPLSFTRVHPSFPHRGMRLSNFQEKRTREDSRASPADNAFATNSFLPISTKDVAMLLAPPAGLEPTTSAFEARHSDSD